MAWFYCVHGSLIFYKATTWHGLYRLPTSPARPLPGAVETFTSRCSRKQAIQKCHECPEWWFSIFSSCIKRTHHYDSLHHRQTMTIAVPTRKRDLLLGENSRNITNFIQWINFSFYGMNFEFTKKYVLPFVILNFNSFQLLNSLCSAKLHVGYTSFSQLELNWLWNILQQRNNLSNSYRPELVMGHFFKTKPNPQKSPPDPTQPNPSSTLGMAY